MAGRHFVEDLWTSGRWQVRHYKGSVRLYQSGRTTPSIEAEGESAVSEIESVIYLLQSALDEMKARLAHNDNQ